MNKEEYYDLNGGKKNTRKKSKTPTRKTKRTKLTKQKFLGEGAYGCTLTPGINCEGKINKYSYKVNKIQEINFNSNNELQISNSIKKINNYKNRFVPINKACIVKFNQIPNNIISKCDNLSEHDASQDYFINKEYYMFYMRLIKGKTLKNFLLDSNSTHIFFNNFFYSLYYLLNSIQILKQNKILHNDLHYYNIICENSTKTPLLIDFGLSFEYKFLFKKSQELDYKSIKRYFFDWRENMVSHLNEKKFISFIIDNRSIYYQSNVDSDYTENTLTKQIIDIFITDIINSIIINNDIKYLFKEHELEYYKVKLQNFYYKFLPENDGKYKYYSDIIKELLPFVLKFNDLHSINTSFILIYYKKYIEKNNSSNFSNYFIIYDFIQSLIKKVYYPVPNDRLTIYQFKSIFSFVFKFCQSIDIEEIKDKKYIEEFNVKFKSLLNDINYNYDLFFNENYASVDFNILLEKQNILLIKQFEAYF
tara:strand:- start:262 stop:1692 length:1431 start_codon:yes stop_codon:yes gene_type:complete